MEPVLGGRDDDLSISRSSPAGCAAMEPVLGGRDDGTWASAGTLWMTRPQWSPSLADGTTGHGPGHPALPEDAAMEPVLGGRDDRDRFGEMGGVDPAAMEPVLGGRDDARGPAERPAREARRNGARPWRTGRRAAALLPYVKDNPPQWSPSLADGTTGDGAARIPGAEVAAMEPVLGGRDDATGDPSGFLPNGPQWSPSLADGTTPHHRRQGRPAGHRRNGARPWRTGRPRTPGRVSERTGGRNGARPWRTGRHLGGTGNGFGSAAPQWSPSLADGTTSTAFPGSAPLPVLPQWSPSLADGTTRHAHGS